MVMTIQNAKDLQVRLSTDFKAKRKWLKHSRDKASEVTGVPAATIRHFENTGEISLRQFLMLAEIYGDLSNYESNFTKPKARTMAELIKMSKD
ncbi:helix-turn-helix domain-containing protein [Neptuniibacter sp. QD37_11]|uniref:helix-turn-helix domain-containing protein n=1 Tax=Neptuniibacter sp. QD37_11 TaxID=3398209 RepID=UPI0039F44CD6